MPSTHHPPPTTKDVIFRCFFFFQRPEIKTQLHRKWFLLTPLRASAGYEEIFLNGFSFVVRNVSFHLTEKYTEVKSWSQRTEKTNVVLEINSYSAQYSNWFIYCLPRRTTTKKNHTHTHITSSSDPLICRDRSESTFEKNWIIDIKHWDTKYFPAPLWMLYQWSVQAFVFKTDKC